MLLFQASRFQWQAHIKTLEAAGDADHGEIVERAVVAFLHMEAEDPDKPKLETKIVKNLKWLANKQGLKHVVLHSFAHLSGSFAEPEAAQALLNRIDKRLTGAGYRVWQTPFGYSCAWDLAVFGDTLAKVFKSL